MANEEDKLKRLQANAKKAQKNNLRTKYSSSSTNFVEWVNTLGIEKTFFGRWIHYLDESFGVRRIVYIFLFCFVLSIFINFEFSLTGIEYQEGDISIADIKSPFNFEFSDYIETAEQKQKAEASIPPIFDYDVEEYDQLYQKLDRGFRTMRVLLAGSNVPRSEVAHDRFATTFLKNKNKFEEILEIRNLTEDIFIWLTKKRFSSLYLSYTYRLLDPISQKKISTDITPLRRTSNNLVIVRTLETGAEQKPVSIEETSSEVKTLTDVLLVKKMILNSDASFLKSIDISDRKILLRFVASLIVPNLSQNIQETAIRRQAARESVPSVLVSVKKGQIIVPEGAPVHKKQIMVLNEVRKISLQRDQDFFSLVTALLLTTLILVLFSFVRRLSGVASAVVSKDLWAMGSITLVVVLLTKVLLLVTDVTVFRELGFSVPDKFFLYLAPIAAAPMIVGLLITRGEIVWLFCIFLAAVLGVMVKFDFNYFLYTVIGGVAGARGVFNTKKRNHVYLAGVRVGIVNVLVICFLTWLTAKDTAVSSMVWYAPSAFFSGIFSALVTMMLTPLFETVFNYTTDVRLLELSNLNHPLLKEMLLKAPGTYHHSVIVGTMAESAAEEIGANPLLSKVGAFYHDIGKMHHSEYFVENQRAGYNPHDAISPHMSKTILIAHVKDGAELAISYKLGKPMLDIILQHHGTTLISYFYNKAKELEDDIHKVSEAEFRYPGPKPQFKEAGLVMLADSIEAAARSLDEPTPARLQNIVKNIIQNKFLDGQLDECNLTLRDLSTIEHVYERILLTIYHQRMDYPTKMGGVDSEKSTNLISVKGR